MVLLYGRGYLLGEAITNAVEARFGAVSVAMLIICLIVLGALGLKYWTAAR